MRRFLSWKNARRVLLALAILLVAIQFVPVTRSSPPVESELDAPAEVKEVLRRACYDCHSHETRWPWYARVAPASWLLARDVREARRELNFSTWNRYLDRERTKKRERVWEEVEEGEMPPWFYLPLHRDAGLSEQDREVLRAWSTGAEP